MFRAQIVNAIITLGDNIMMESFKELAALLRICAS